MSLDRRNFLKKVGAAQAGAILSTGGRTPDPQAC